MKRIAVLTSGGDAPGMNAAIRFITLLGASRGCEVYGVRQGYDGLVSGNFTRLEPDAVAGTIREGGTILGSARCLAFHERETRDQAREHLQRAGIEGLIVIGGNGSLTGMTALTAPEENTTGLRAIGIPASIDNDVGFTRLAIGVDTAINTIMEACDKISDTASAHNRTFIVEVMGRDCGYLAMTSAIASAANAVLFPEMNCTEEEIVESVARAVELAHKRANRSKRVLVIKSEGVKISNERLMERLDEVLVERLGQSMKNQTRLTVLGHVVRGGRPSALDRQIASRLAAAAVVALLSGKTRLMAAWRPPHGMPESIVHPSPHDRQVCLVDIEHVLVETRAMLDGSSTYVQWRKPAFQEFEDVLAL